MATRTLVLMVLALHAGFAVGAGDVSVSEQAPVRSAARVDAPVVDVLPSGAVVRVESSAHPWHRVLTRGAEGGWVAGTLQGGWLVPDEALAGAPGRLAPHLRVHVAAPLRSAPALGRPESARLEPGVVRTLEQHGSWALVQAASGATGWIDVLSVPVSAAGREDVQEMEAAEQARAAQDGRRPRERRADAAETTTPDEDEAARDERRRLEFAERAAEHDRRVQDAAAERQRRADERERVAAEHAEAARADRDRQELARDRQELERERREEAKRARRDEDTAERARAHHRDEAAPVTAPPEPPPAEDAPSVEPEARDRDEAARSTRAARRAEEEAEDERRRLEREDRERREDEEAAERRALKDERVSGDSREAAAARLAAATPVDLPPSVAVEVPKAAPSERKPDPRQSPLARESPEVPDRPIAIQVGEDPAVDVSATPLSPHDDDVQLERSVRDFHADRDALDVSLERRAGEAPELPGYVNERGQVVPTRVVSEVVARVNQEILTSAEFEQRVDEALEQAKLAGAPPEAQDRELVSKRTLGRMLEELLLVDQARALGMRFDRIYERAKEEFMRQAGIQDDLELLRLLDATGQSWDDFRRVLVRRRVPWLVLQQQVLARIAVPEEDIESHYRRHQADWAGQDCVRLREIVLQPEARETTRGFSQRLEEVLRRLEQGEDFCDLARRHSRAPSAADCGRLEPCFTGSTLDSKVARVVFRMRVGDVEPIRTEWGYHVVEVLEHRPSQVPPLEDVRDQIIQAIRRERAGELVPAYIDKLRRTAYVDVAPRYEKYYEDGVIGEFDGGAGL